MTKRQLVQKLHRLGFHDVSERRITDWIEKGLLPQVDSRGGGLGKGKGRMASAWTDGRLVSRQAVWVAKLLNIYRYSDKVFLPLFILGFDVPVHIVRDTLLAPLDEIIGSFEEEAIETLSRSVAYDRKGDLLEDYIGDLAFRWSKREPFAEILGIPQEVVEVPLNILFNSDYELEDVGFEDGVAQLAVWKERVNTEIIPFLLEGVERPVEDSVKPIRPEGLEIVFERPDFFQKYLSIPALQKAVSEADENDFMNVKLDMQVFHTIAKSFRRILLTLVSQIDYGSFPKSDEILQLIFTLSHLLVVVDLSLRRNGFDDLLNRLRAEVPTKISEDLDHVSDEDLAKAGKEISKAMKGAVRSLTKNFENLIAQRGVTPAT